ncbi:anaerobic ribonucleoside-triphosphate reductase activating protein [Candidatus Oleimmundimicrobium sp.]|uniref:anaerobic ribonucleoside-triphosphate reductase activating protein n=1 Tax=Candidatus Oleimmundimicrobium sp. TaxID=3060597 RepID=UPI00271FFD00|nr:anaerobic ribonucleoside-triphosphate reductase activating protein [Candidatus Oleimmundimicrobium sp.]MDO8885399.1 anaerobic ribonucleoside-triphosphate reductase activating protein [Candidatus Oleimmundimicrobium sp.]
MLKVSSCLESSSIELRGIVPVTMLDWVGRVACVLFVGGCNFKCPFCHNPELVLSPKKQSLLSWEKVRQHLETKKKWLDGVIITGGEPTIEYGLEDFLSILKEMDYSVKLDTNGTRPRVLSRLIKEELVDHIAMDVKSSFRKYSKAAGVSVNIEKIKKSIDLIVNSGISHEFRTTVVPKLAEKEDVIEIAQYLGNRKAQHYYLQQYNPKVTLDPKLMETKPYKRELLINLTEECLRFVPTELRG